MLTPRLTNCPECSDIPTLLQDIDCKMAQWAKKLYNNTIFALNQAIDGNAMFDLLNYKRILTYKFCNSDYGGYYTVNMIASKVKLLTAGCKCKDCVPNVIPDETTSTSTTSSTSSTTSSTTSTTTTTTTTLPVTTTSTTTIPSLDCMTFDGFNSSSFFKFNIGVSKSIITYILGNTTITLPSLNATFGNSYGAGYGVNFTNSYTGSTIISGDYNVWFNIGGLSGPYVYTYNIQTTGSIDLPLGKFNVNFPSITSAFDFQFSYTDKNGTDLTSLLTNFTTGDAVFLTNCIGVTPPI